ncbi:MAG: hypothetical protein Q7S84_03565 [bacterium]|nr:hypothetical protein [bacterium]
MTTITIPRGLHETKELVAVPRRTYEDFLAWQEQVKSKHVFIASSAEKRAIQKGRKDFKNGRYLTLDAVRSRMERRR